MFFLQFFLKNFEYNWLSNKKTKCKNDIYRGDNFVKLTIKC